MKKNLLYVLICSICLAACEKDPTFDPEAEKVEINAYVGNIGYSYADVYCQILSNVDVSSVSLELSAFKDMKRSVSYPMTKTTNYPIEAEFDKVNIVYKTNLSDLENGSTYYGRIIVKTNIGGSYEKDDIVFSTESLASTGIITKPATNISFTYATLNGEVTSASDIYVYETGFYYSQNSNMSDALSVEGNSNYGSFKQEVYNLEANKTYYFQAYAIIKGETYKGQVLSFRTDEYSEAKITTNEALEIGYIDAIVSYVITDKGNSSVKEAGILWGESSSIDISTGVKIKGSGNYENTTYKVTIEGLSPSEIYYYRAYVINNYGVSYGEIKIFFTKSLGDIWVMTGEPTNITRKSARLHYSIKSEGYAIAQYGILFSKYDNTNINPYTLDGNAVFYIGYKAYGSDLYKSDSYYSISSWLTPGTYYEYQAFVEYTSEWGEKEILFGDVVNFVTLE